MPYSYYESNVDLHQGLGKPPELCRPHFGNHCLIHSLLPSFNHFNAQQWTLRMKPKNSTKLYKTLHDLASAHLSRLTSCDVPSLNSAPAILKGWQASALAFSSPFSSSLLLLFPRAGMPVFILDGAALSSTILKSFPENQVYPLVFLNLALFQHLSFSFVTPRTVKYLSVAYLCMPVID